ncbi:glycoside hydrolase family 36 protein [Cohnella abietis]|uniref:Alpha-galactosidase n=1 Tax=Cohnella abietis TaxID=2507935 RepID=A0A3T1DBK8_9BACL|nr:glycoside hydrolase family 36 protein [Cohnella abietis]BBI35490.1 hypothetical protein KCTCHS21_48890 [Cohnella abietis]
MKSYSDVTSLTLTHEQLALGFEQTDKGLWQSELNTASNLKGIVPPRPAPPFQLSIAGKPYGTLSSMVSGMTGLPDEMKMTTQEIQGDTLLLGYVHEKLNLTVEVHMQFIPGVSVIRQRTIVRNLSEQPITITHLSSASPQGIAGDGIRPWSHSKKIKVHYCRQTWNGEGQWRSGSLEELGLYPTSTHPTASSIHWSSVGSQSTSRYLPMLIIEDLETSKVWFTQIETTSNWHLELGYRGSTINKGGLFLHADGADERYGGWYHVLGEGESYESVPVAYGCCTGGFNQAIRQLTKYRRDTLKPALPTGMSVYPLVFNDYMNCLWADPTEEKLRRQIDAAADCGADFYCIDAGWFASLKQNWGQGLGDWIPSKDRFGKQGLKGIFDYIRSKNLGIGIWIEMEVCGEEAALAHKPDSWFLVRHGERVGGGPRWFLNFSNPEVRQYIDQVITSLIDLGATLIRNDCNDCIGSGDNRDGQSAASGLLQNMRDFYSFIDEVRMKHPHILLENCSSGGMRSDYGMLSHFHLHSTSDQEHYADNPSIISGLLAAVLPEQAEFWAYPYPLVYDQMGNPGLVHTPSYIESMSSGEQTIFNMVNGLCGNMYLSGRIDAADSLNKQLIQEGTHLYKQYRSYLHQSYPVWPLGFVQIGNKQAWNCVGFADEEDGRLLLAVWRLGSAEPYQEITIPGWNGAEATLTQIYPVSEQFAVPASYNSYLGSLTVHFPLTNQARYFELRKIDR